MILKNRSFFPLWIGQIISQFGDRINQMALIGLVYSRFGTSTLQLAKLFSFAILPVFLIGPLAGVYVDRWSKKYTMLLSDILRGFFVLIIALHLLNLKVFFPVYIVVFLVFCVSRFFVPAKLAIIPKIVKDEQINMANSLISTTGMVASILGFGIGGYIVERLGPKNSFTIDSLTFFISAIFILFIRERKEERFSSQELINLAKNVVVNVRKRFFEEMREGVVYILKEKNSIVTLRSLFVLFAALGGLYTVMIVFIQETLGSTTKDLGILAVGLGMGLFLSSLIYGRTGFGLSVERIINVMLFSGSILLVLFVLLIEKFSNIILASILAFLLGACIGPIIVGSMTLIHRTCQRHLQGRIFSSLEVVIHFSFILFMFLGSFISTIIGHFLFIVSIAVALAFYSLCSIFREYTLLRRVISGKNSRR